MNKDIYKDEFGQYHEVDEEYANEKRHEYDSEEYSEDD